jgi:hypothetical protein
MNGQDEARWRLARLEEQVRDDALPWGPAYTADDVIDVELEAIEIRAMDTNIPLAELNRMVEQTQVLLAMRRLLAERRAAESPP